MSKLHSFQGTEWPGNVYNNINRLGLLKMRTPDLWAENVKHFAVCNCWSRNDREKKKKKNIHEFSKIWWINKKIASYSTFSRKILLYLEDHFMNILILCCIPGIIQTDISFMKVSRFNLRALQLHKFVWKQNTLPIKY